MTPWHRRLALLLLLSGAGCDSEPAPESSEYVATDGWTGEIVVHAAADLESAPELQLVEHLRLGSLDGPEETQFFRIADADVADGELWVLDSGHDEVRVFDFQSGAWLRTVGRRGEGPGEFTSPSQLNIHDGIVSVREFQRTTLFDLERNLLATGPGLASMEEDSSNQPVQAGPNWFRTEMAPRVGAPPRDVPFRDTTLVFSLDPRAEGSDREIFRYPTGERLMPSGEFEVTFTPFTGVGPVTHGGADGNFYYTPADEYRVDIIDVATGAQLRRVVNTMEPGPVSQAVFDDAVRREEEAVPEIPAGDPFRKIVRSAIDTRKNLPVPSARRITNAIRVAADGRWAIIRGDLDPNPLDLGDPARWDVYGSDGEILGWFMSEPGANIRRFTGDHVIAREEDEMEIQQLVVYRLDYGSGGR